MTLTNSDFKGIKELIVQAIDENETLVRKEDVKHLPTKEEFYDQTDKLMKELRDMREEHTMLLNISPAA